MVVGFLPAIGSSLWSFNATGQVERLYAHARWYQKAGHTVDWFTYHPWDMAWPFGRRVVVRPTLRHAVLAALQDGAWRARPRVHVFRALNLLGALPAVVARWTYGTPFVVSVGADYEAIARIHGRPAWKWRWLHRAVIPFASSVLVSNPDLASRLRRDFPAAHIVDHPNWIDPALFHPIDTGVRWKRAVPRVYFVGRLVKEKNLVTAARAIQRAGARMVCVGAGPLEAEVRAAGAEVVGVQPWPSLPNWLADAEAFIMPSLSEGQPKALLEAMACGVQCLVSKDITGLDSYPLIRVDTADEEALKKAVQSALVDRFSFDLLGGRGRELMERWHDVRPLMRAEIDEVRAAA